MKINFIKLLYEEENDMKKNKGITLVALVVTIVVLLILAGVSINLVLGNNGIIAKAKDAETKSAEASQNDLKGMNGLVSEMEGALAENGSNGSGSGNGNTGSENNFVTKNTEVTYPDGKVWIPEGFKIAKGSASTVQGGVVIEDKDGNQFVWVPVATLADYKRTWYTEYDSFSSYSEALPEDEKTSVERYKGFYIGRYEAGDKESTVAKTLRSSNDVTKTVTIKANDIIKNYIEEVNTKWEDNTNLNISSYQLIARLAEVTEIQDIASITFNSNETRTLETGSDEIFSFETLVIKGA